MTDLTDRSTWLPLDELQPGFDAFKASHCTELAGRTVTLVDARGTRISHRFEETEVEWDYCPGVGDPIPGSTHTDAYEAFLVDAGLYLVLFHHQHEPREAIALVLDLRDGRALSVVQAIGDLLPGSTAVRQLFVPSLVEEVRTLGDGPAPTSSLLGRRVLWRYSDDHAYEHVYLSRQWYSWQCLTGPEQGLADTDECTTWEMRPGIVVFAWREKVIACASVTVADHRDASALRSHGVLFGLDESGKVPVHFGFGAHGRLLSVTVHPEQLDPAR